MGETIDRFHQPQDFAPAEAEELARELNASDEDGWDYWICSSPRHGYRRIAVYDDKGDFVEEM